MQHVTRFAIAACLLALGSVALAADITVFAASSLKESLDESVKMFTTKTGHRVRVSYAGSNALARQIENGAPANLFISADEEWMDYLAQKNLLAPDTRRNLVANALVLIAPATSTVQLSIAPGFALGASLKGGRLALANPQAVPIGKYAKAALTTLGVWRDIEKSVTGSENVRAALLLVALGEAPLGIVYATDAKAEPKVRIVDTFAASLHPPVVYPAAAIAGKLNPATQALLDYLSGEAARQIWVRHGFAIAR